MNKFDKAQKILQDLDADGWLIACNEDSDINSRFLLGVESHALHYVYVSAIGEHEVVAVEMEAPMIKRSLDNKGVKANVRTYNSMDKLKTLLKPIIDKPRIALNFGENVLENGGTSYADYIRAGDFASIKKLVPDTDLISAAPIIYGLRSVKSKEQLDDLKNTCKATLELLEQIPDWCKIGMTERELQAKLEYEYMKLGRPSFPAIIASGSHSADPHHNTSMKKIEPGVLLIDTGLIIDEMCSDITWTFWIQGEPSEQFLNAYNVLYKSKIEANKYMIDGIPNCIPAVKCRKYIEKEGYDHEKLFFHGFGHSLGFEAHDIGERISRSVPENIILKENMVYTNEPGLYWRDKWGIRLEDDVIIGKEKCEVVTYNPEKPIVI